MVGGLSAAGYFDEEDSPPIQSNVTVLSGVDSTLTLWGIPLSSFGRTAEAKFVAGVAQTLEMPGDRIKVLSVEAADQSGASSRRRARRLRESSPAPAIQSVGTASGDGVKVNFVVPTESTTSAEKVAGALEGSFPR